ncbi:conserved hypothetical protein [Rippkaea orientalis PCC 8801]|uniref:DUF1868 domain-containing protein n=1 Tax=Rippkaea orientalis (strain PCC 8801 / RF-1) TaxID=41431 RepID=B7K657_RIPO1|nr:DUF1868 domain-containing protein [Rippkaea orientalis]ACK68110.1 conserved hypothetical protein [Rippkaea orientalis PCC 8801]
MDETYQIYVNRVAQLTIQATYQTQLQNIQKSPKFEQGKAISFPGYTVLTPPQIDDTLNREFYYQLQAIQQQLIEQIEPGMLTWLPPESFHLTLADLIWDKRYQEAVQDHPSFDDKIKACIQHSFDNYPKINLENNEPKWQLFGLLIFPRALVVGLVPCDELSYEKIIQLRRAIYQNMDLIGLGIQQQYHFTAHITLGYFSENISNLNRDKFASILTNFNDKWLETEPQVLKIREVELRKFEDMITYLPSDDNPKIEL